MPAEAGTGAGTRPRGLPGSLEEKSFVQRFRGARLGGLFAPVDIASLCFFRVAFGSLMYWEISRYFSNGWVGPLYAEPTFRFTFYGFGWIRAWPDQWMHLHFLTLQVLALLIAVGYLYRVSAALFFLGFTYIFLLDQANYLNHFYLICLISLLMIFVPAHRAFSVDAWMRSRIRSRTIPAWTLWLLMAQVGLVYFYGGLAKLNGDWLRGEPMRTWLAVRTDFPVIGRFFTEEWMVYLFSYGGLLLDLLVVPFLLWRRTRLAAFAFALSFHLTNVQLFDIGVFPWFMMAATLLFFPPWWPRAVGRLRISDGSPRPRGTGPRAVGSGCVIGCGGARATEALRRNVSAGGGTRSSGCSRSTARSRSSYRSVTTSTPATLTGPRRGTASPGTCCFATRRCS